MLGRRMPGVASAAAMIFGLASEAGATGFLPAPGFRLASGAADVQAGDADGDGFDEIALAQSATRQVAVLWNQGLAAPAFSAPDLLDVSITVASLALADLDSDGLADLAAAGSSADANVVVRLARPGRSFAPPRGYPLPAGPAAERQVAAVDLDGDGWRDLVVGYDSHVASLRNRGNGDFDPAISHGSPGAGLLRLLPAELDGQPGTDLLVARDDGLQTWANDGLGGLLARPALTTGLVMSDVAVLDLDRDGRLDAALADGTLLRLYRNDGSGAFSAGATRPLPGGLASESLAADLNADGIADLIVAASSATFSVLAGDGAGAVGGAVIRTLPSAPGLLALGDFNGDGDRGDLVTMASTLDGELRISAGVARLSLPWTAYPAGRRPAWVATGDLDGDGDVDLAAANPGSKDVSLLWNDGAGGFSPAPPSRTSRIPLRVAARDIDGDGLKDLVLLVTNIPPGFRGVSGAAVDPVGYIEVLQNLGGGAFRPLAAPASDAGKGPAGLAVGDLDGDGKLDAVVANAIDGTLAVFRNSGSGLSRVSTLVAGQGPMGVALADLDGDGRLDLATAASGQGLVFVNQGSFLFSAPVGFSAGQGPVDLAALDLDLDGRSDLALLDAVSGSVDLYRNEAGGFRLSGTTAIAGAPLALAAADMNCDAATDLLVASAAGPTDSVVALLSEGNGTTAPLQGLAAGMGPNALAAGNLDGEGAEDPVVVVGGEDELRLSLNSACRGGAACLGAAVSIAGPQAGCSGAAVALAATQGFASYRWSNGDLGPEILLPLRDSGVQRLRLDVLDAAGCAASAEASLSVLRSPELQVEAPHTYGCASNSEPLRFAVRAVDPRGGAGGQRFHLWSVEQPGRVLAPEQAETAIEFPAATALGEYIATATVTDTTGCSSVETVRFRFVSDAPPGAPVGNTLRVCRGAGSRLRLTWTPSLALVHGVLRRAGKDPGGAATSVASALETAELEDDPPPGLWFYEVRPQAVCGTLWTQ